MAKIGFKGHLIRGTEIISLLETLGGNNDFNLTGTSSDKFYYINDFRVISSKIDAAGLTVYNINEFDKKYPYRINDKVFVKGGKDICRVHTMKWTGKKIEYYTTGFYDEACSADELKIYEKASKTLFSKKKEFLRDYLTEENFIKLCEALKIHLKDVKDKDLIDIINEYLKVCG